MDVVVDVGGVYDPTRHRYDHHQVFVMSSIAGPLIIWWNDSLHSKTPSVLVTKPS